MGNLLDGVISDLPSWALLELEARISQPFFTATVPHSYIGWGKTTHLGYGIPLMYSAPSSLGPRSSA